MCTSTIRPLALVIGLALAAPAAVAEEAAVSLEQLLAGLESGSYQAREEAGRRIVELGAEAAPAVDTLLEKVWAAETKEPVRGSMAVVAAELGASGLLGDRLEPLLDTLILALSGEDLLGSSHAIESLGRLGGRALPRVLRALDEPASRLNAVRALGRMGEAAARAVPLLLVYVESPEGRGLSSKEDLYALRAEAVRALTEIGPPAREAIPLMIRGAREGWLHWGVWGRLAPLAIPELVKLLESGDPAAAQMAIDAIWSMGAEGAAATPHLAAFVKRNRDNRLLVSSAMNALAASGEGAAPAVPLLLPLLVEPELHNSIGMTLSQIGAAHSLEPLVALLEDPMSLPDEVTGAAVCLARFGTNAESALDTVVVRLDGVAAELLPLYQQLDALRAAPPPAPAAATRAALEAARAAREAQWAKREALEDEIREQRSERLLPLCILITAIGRPHTGAAATLARLKAATRSPMQQLLGALDVARNGVPDPLDTLKAVLRRARSVNPTIRDKALLQIRLGDRNIGPFRPVLRSAIATETDPDILWAILRWYERSALGCRDCAPDLLPLLGHKSLKVRAMALQTICTIDLEGRTDLAPLLPVALEVVADRARPEWIKAATLLRRAGPEAAAAVPHLVAALTREEPPSGETMGLLTCNAACYGLGGAGAADPDAAVAALLRVLEWSHYQYLLPAIDALSSLGEPAAPAAPTLRRLSASDPHPMVREAAQRALLKIVGQDRRK